MRGRRQEIKGSGMGCEDEGGAGAAAEDEAERDGPATEAERREDWLALTTALSSSAWADAYAFLPS